MLDQTRDDCADLAGTDAASRMQTKVIERVIAAVDALYCESDDPLEMLWLLSIRAALLEFSE
jgi:hypothetical protein